MPQALPSILAFFFILLIDTLNSANILPFVYLPIFNVGFFHRFVPKSRTRPPETIRPSAMSSARFANTSRP